jgi:hypothetical protein
VSLCRLLDRFFALVSYYALPNAGRPQMKL